MPPAAADRFGACADRLTAYGELLADDGVVRGLIGPREVPRLWERHLLNCAVVEELIPADTRLADVGSGAGLPGLVLAIVRPDLRVTLVEPLLRRSTFLSEVVERLGLVHVEVVRARAEDLVGARSFEVVTARAVAPLDKLAAWCAPILTPGGRILALKGDRAESELAEGAGVLDRLGLSSGRILQAGDGLVDPVTTVVELTASARTPTRTTRPSPGRRTKGRDPQ